LAARKNELPPAPRRRGRAAVAARFVAAAGLLDLDDLGAEVGEHLARERPREDAGQVDDANAVELARHLLSPTCGTLCDRLSE
jgi:hypothetical protein